MKYLIFGLTFLLFFSCSNSEDIREVENFEEAILFNSSFRTTNFANLESELLDFWAKGLEEYSLETFCSCDCDGVFAAQDMINNHRDLMPSIFTNNHQHDLTCDELKTFMSYDCQFETLSEYRNFIGTKLSANDTITQGEIDLVLDILDDIENKQLDIPSYRKRWANLADNSIIDNYYSALIIEIANSGEIFLDAFENEDDDVQALWNKVGGAILGGAIALTVRVCYDGVVSNGDIVDTVVCGAIGGAIRSL